MLRLLSVGSWLISNHHLWLVSSQRLGNVSWGTDTILQLVINRRGESSIQLQQFHKSGWYFYWWSSSSNNWWLETNQHWYCCWKSAASQTCIIFNKLVVTSQDLSVRQLILLNRWWFDIKSSFLNNEESKKRIWKPFLSATTFQLPVFSATAIKIIAMAITIQNWYLFTNRDQLK